MTTLHIRYLLPLALQPPPHPPHPRRRLLGHSDRRNVFGEDDALIADKCGQALAVDGLCVNLTVGETRQQRDAGEAEATLHRQLGAAAAAIPAGAWGRVAVAYEPVWAVGPGATPCSPAECEQVLAGLRGWVSVNAGPAAAESVRMLYTGSVNSANAASYARLPSVDGFVVGRAGLDLDQLTQICDTLTSCKAKLLYTDGAVSSM